MRQPQWQVKGRGARLVSPIPLRLLPVTVSNPVTTEGVKVQAVLDCGCTRTIVNLQLVEALGVALEPMERTIKLAQMDGEFSKGGEASNRTAPLHLDIEQHWECFQPVVAPRVAFPFVLGLDWLRKHDPSVRWRSRVLSFTDPSCSSHCRKAAPEFPKLTHLE